MLDYIVKSMFSFVRAIKLSSKGAASFCIPTSNERAPVGVSVFWILATVIGG